jgi:Mg2+ and Co2+ transporter CorA
MWSFGIDFRAAEHGFATHDIDFFLGPNYLVTVHDGTSRSIVELRDHCPRNTKILGEGPVALFHRIVDSMVEHYRPEVEKLEDRLNDLEKEIFDNPRPATFMPLTLLAGLWGVNVMLPQFPGGQSAQFWWLCGISLVVIVVMLALFRRKRWI